MSILAHFLLFLCLLVLSGSHGGGCSQKPEEKQAQQQAGSKAPAVHPAKNPIDWKKTAQKINELERVKKEMFETITRKAQARENTARQQPRKEDTTQHKRGL